jgi:hypothetical protein
MPGLVPGIHVLCMTSQDMDVPDIQRKDALLPGYEYP